MNYLPHSIELHDSEISTIERNGEELTIKFSHAYIHKNGKGWSQTAEIQINSAEVNSNQKVFPAKVADGWLETKKGPYHNLLMIPFDTDGEVVLKIEFFSENTAIITGNGIQCTFTSEPVFIEEFPHP